MTKKKSQVVGDKTCSVTTSTQSPVSEWRNTGEGEHQCATTSREESKCQLSRIRVDESPYLTANCAPSLGMVGEKSFVLDAPLSSRRPASEDFKVERLHYNTSTAAHKKTLTPKSKPRHSKDAKPHLRKKISPQDIRYELRRSSGEWDVEEQEEHEEDYEFFPCRSVESEKDQIEDAKGLLLQYTDAEQVQIEEAIRRSVEDSSRMASEDTQVWPLLRPENVTASPPPTSAAWESFAQSMSKYQTRSSSPDDRIEAEGSPQLSQAADPEELRMPIDSDGGLQPISSNSFAPEAITAFQQALEEGDQQLRSVKLCFVGHARAGKTNTLRSLAGDAFNEDQPSTHGITTCSFSNDLLQTPAEVDSDWKKINSIDSVTVADIFENDIKSSVADILKREISAISNFARTESTSSTISSCPEILKMPCNLFASSKNSNNQEDNEKEPIVMQTWDFAGQKVYYDMVHLFLTAAGIYAFIMNLADWLPHVESGSESSSKHIEALEFWLTALLLHAPNARLIIVGTHDDLLPEEWRQYVYNQVQQCLRNCFRQRQMRQLEVNGCLQVNEEQQLLFFPVANPRQDDVARASINRLRAKLNMLANMQVQAVGRVRTRYLHFFNVLSKWRAEQKAFHISYDKCKELAAPFGFDCGDASASEDFENFLTQFHDLGHLLYFSGAPAIVLDPQWLLDAMANVINCPRVLQGFSFEPDQLQEEGKLTKDLLSALWKDERFAGHHGILQAFLEHFDLLVEGPCSGNASEYWLVPSLIGVRPCEPQPLLSLPTQPQALVTGEWSYGEDGKYKIFNRGNQLIFQEKDREGVLHRLGDWWQSDLKFGIIRLKSSGDRAVLSQFKAIAQLEWGHPIISRKVDSVSAQAPETASLFLDFSGTLQKIMPTILARLLSYLKRKHNLVLRDDEPIYKDHVCFRFASKPWKVTLELVPCAMPRYMSIGISKVDGSALRSDDVKSLLEMIVAGINILLPRLQFLTKVRCPLCERRRDTKTVSVLDHFIDFDEVLKEGVYCDKMEARLREEDLPAFVKQWRQVARRSTLSREMVGEPRRDLRVAYLYANPLELPELNYFREYQACKDVPGVSVRAHAVRRENLKQILMETPAPDVVHLNCHGGNKCIILEDSAGRRKDVTADELLQLTKGEPQELVYEEGPGLWSRCKLLLLLSCDSYHLVEPLLKKNECQVVCVAGKVLDRAVLLYIQGLYRGLVAGYSVESSHELAKGDLRRSEDPGLNTNQADMFILFGPAEHSILDLSMAPAHNAQWEPTRHWKSFSRVDNFMCRYPEMISAALHFDPSTKDKMRVIVCWGEDGIGKSAFCLEFCRFFSAPGRLFSSGVFMLDYSKEVEKRLLDDSAATFDELFSRALLAEIARAGRNTSSVLAAGRGIETAWEALRNAVSDFNAPWLLVVDNVNDGESLQANYLREILARLLTIAPHMCILLAVRTTSKQLGNIYGQTFIGHSRVRLGVQPPNVEPGPLLGLPKTAAAKLFSLHAKLHRGDFSLEQCEHAANAVSGDDAARLLKLQILKTTLENGIPKQILEIAQNIDEGWFQSFNEEVHQRS
mmetsp:Transcript_65884/g.104360  ORF Transcript_65884/g.104360 Transcript_65884/m.104360 type:complete len:1561 (-) Transcript_65884:180-4862(-)